MCCSCRKQCVDGQQRHWCELVRLDGNEKEKVIQILDTPLTLEMRSLLRMLCCLSLCKCQWDFLSTITWMRSNAILACKNIYWEGSFSTRFGVNSVRSKSLKNQQNQQNAQNIMTNKNTEHRGEHEQINGTTNGPPYEILLTCPSLQSISFWPRTNSGLTCKNSDAKSYENSDAKSVYIREANPSSLCTGGGPSLGPADGPPCSGFWHQIWRYSAGWTHQYITNKLPMVKLHITLHISSEI